MPMARTRSTSPAVAPKVIRFRVWTTGATSAGPAAGAAANAATSATPNAFMNLLLSVRRMGGAPVKHASLRSTQMSQLVPADGTLIDRILDGTHELWHDGLARQPYGRFWQAQLATPWGQHRLTRWALVDGGRLLCSAKLYTFDAVLDGRALQIAGIGAVFTPI